jgi:lipoate-protein ligase A
MTTPSWQLHWDGPADGRYNMAKDALLLERAAAEGSAALRLYAWDRMTLSVGRAQKVERQIDLGACAAHGIPVVRRETGGRAVLHGSDLTYSIAAPLSGPRFSGGILGIYREISQAFLNFFSGLGVGAECKAYAGRERAESASPVCFVTPSAFEILLRGKKVVGSAQRQVPRAFLQHGSIPLEPQLRLLSEIFHSAAASQIAAQMTDLRSEGCYPRHSVADLRRRLVDSFGAVFGIAFEPAPWTPADEAAVTERTAEFPWIEAGAAPAVPAASIQTGTSHS